eukprot:GSChrysophyteH1.ASY1.ANO1.1734.1 assembled CDS
MLFLLALITFSVLHSVSSCTTFVISAGATSDGSVMAAHSADGGGNTDPRLVRIPGNRYPKGSKRKVYYSPESYPRYVGNDPRSPTGSVPQYLEENCQEGEKYCAPFVELAEIDQVEETYSYYEAVYGVMNQHQVGISESTCSAVYAANGKHNGGRAVMSINALSQIAMERAATSREACQIMGDLAVKHGFYGASNSFEGGGESLIVTDKKEAFVFHILADPTGESAIWVAARVPDGHVAVVANMYSVREVNLTDTPMDWTKTFSDGEYAHKYYSGRRMWGVFRRAAPETELPPFYGNLKDDAPYPFSIPVSVPKAEVNPTLMFSIMREFYNNTEFSLGSWERSIALYRTAESYIVQSGGYNRDTNSSTDNDALGGIVWFGAHSSTYTVYVPVLSGGILNIPKSLSDAWQGTYDLTSNFWASRSLSVLAQVKWKYMISDIQAMQSKLEDASKTLVQTIYNKYDNAQKVDMRKVEKLQNENIAEAVRSSMELFHKLLFRWADGFESQWTNEGTPDKHFTSVSPGYPAWWLEEVDYSKGPPPP